jgi:membrane associated rhomboid family serine protease
VRAPILVGGFIATDLLLAFSAPESSISHSGHLGGALYGLLYALYLRRRFGRR